MVHEFQKKKRPVVSRGRIYIIIVAILILFFFVLLIPANFKIAKRKAELMQRYYSLKKEVDDLKSKNSKIEAEILNTSNNFTVAYTSTETKASNDLTTAFEKVNPVTLVSAVTLFAAVNEVGIISPVIILTLVASTDVLIEISVETIESA